MKEKELIEYNYIAEKEEKILLDEMKKEETKKIIGIYIEKDKNGENERDDEYSTMPDDSDHINQEYEYEQWKIRELRRIKKTLEEDEEKLKEKKEIERRRNLTDEQRREEDLRLGTDESLKPSKTKLNFLQKYYHKGAFFQSDAQISKEHVFNRDYNLPTWQDKIDRSNLPKILQKRRGTEFKKGQTKYTHLTNEDTTNFDPKYKVPENIVNKLWNNTAGIKAKESFELGRKRKLV